jgi:RimJ/RimL family protein N-acetyltransferase
LKGPVLKIRLLEYKDLETIYRWRVDPETIIWTKSNNSFSKATHIDWFKKRLESLESHPMVILEINNMPIGYVRFDKQAQGNSLYEVSIFLELDFRNKKLGSLALSASLNFLNLNSASLLAQIHVDNEKSIKFFEKEGFLFSAKFEKFLTYSRGPVLLDSQ